MPHSLLFFSVCSLCSLVCVSVCICFSTFLYNFLYFLFIFTVASEKNGGFDSARSHSVWFCVNQEERRIREERDQSKKADEEAKKKSALSSMGSNYSSHLQKVRTHTHYNCLQRCSSVFFQQYNDTFSSKRQFQVQNLLRPSEGSCSIAKIEIISNIELVSQSGAKSLPLFSICGKRGETKQTGFITTMDAPI